MYGISAQNKGPEKVGFMADVTRWDNASLTGKTAEDKLEILSKAGRCFVRVKMNVRRCMRWVNIHNL